MTAQSGSVQAAARQTGVSISTASHHLRQLETTLGTPLLDHTKRPLRVTPAGAVFQRDVESALRLIRTAHTNVQALASSRTATLSLAVIEDFDSEIAPELARSLTNAMPDCKFRHLTRPSHEILDLLQAGEIEIGLATGSQSQSTQLNETPILRDPFVMAFPADHPATPEAVFAGANALSFLRYSSNQFMAQQIEQQLRRLKRILPDQHEFESNQTLMRLVAEGAGWTITTPLNYLRAQRFRSDIRLAPFPEKGFARTVSLFHSDSVDASTLQTVEEMLRRLIETRAVAPLTRAVPWLSDRFRMLEPARPEF